MKINRILLFAVSLLMTLSLQTAYAQTGVTPPSSPSLSKGDVLIKDTRLEAMLPGIDDTILGKEKRIRLSRLFSWFNKNAHVKLYCPEESLSNAHIFTTFNKVRASDLMDGIAALWLTRWEKDPSRSYRMLGRGGIFDFLFLPKEENRRERYAAGTEFMDGIADLPKEGIVADFQAGKSITAGDLPPAVRQSLARLIAADSKEAITNGFNPHFPLEKLTEATLKLQTTPHKQNEQGFSEWFINVHLKDYGEMGFMFTDYERQMAKRPADADDAIYVPLKYAITDKEALTLPTLRRTVQLQMKQATIVEVLAALHKKYGISIVSDSPEWMKNRADVAIQAENIGAAFDKLGTIFPGIQWEYRPS